MFMIHHIGVTHHICIFFFFFFGMWEFVFQVWLFLLVILQRVRYLLIKNFHSLNDCYLQLRDSISQDQEKTESLKIQMKDWETSIQDVESKILHEETTLKELRKLQDQISTHSTARSTLFKLQQTQYAALAEENEGFAHMLTS